MFLILMMLILVRFNDSKIAFIRRKLLLGRNDFELISDQSCKRFTIENYDCRVEFSEQFSSQKGSRVVINSLVTMTLESYDEINSLVIMTLESYLCKQFSCHNES